MTRTAGHPSLSLALRVGLLAFVWTCRCSADDDDDDEPIPGGRRPPHYHQMKNREVHPAQCRNFDYQQHQTLHDFPPEKTIDGGWVNFKELAEKMVFITNVPVHGKQAYQIEDLNTLHDMYEARGFVIIGLPTNEFGELDHRPDKEIMDDMHKHGHRPKFPLLETGEVNGPDAHAVFTWLKESCGGHPIEGHFEKFFVNRWGWPLLRAEEKVPVMRYKKLISEMLDKRDKQPGRKPGDHKKREEEGLDDDDDDDDDTEDDESDDNVHDKEL